MQQELGSISNTYYSKANKNSFYNKQKEHFEKNIQEYHASTKKNHVHKHVKEITEMFKNLANHPCSKPHSHPRWSFTLSAISYLFH